MLLRLAALGALGYAGYKYLQKNGGLSSLTGGGWRGDKPSQEPDVSKPDVALAGGPLSTEASVVHPGEPLPAT